MLKQTPTSTPASRFTDNGDGTVTDTKTGLMWKKFSEGHAPGSTAVRLRWKDALEHAQAVNGGGGFANHADWRVPSIRELCSITNKQGPEAAIDLGAFPDTPPDIFWSSSTVAYHSGYAWAVGFHDGDGGCNHQDNCHHLRLVRGADDDHPSAPVAGGSGRKCLET